MSSFTHLPPLQVRPPFAELHYVAPYTEGALDRYRTMGDRAVDAIVADLAADGPLGRVGDLLGTVRERAAAGDARCGAFLDDATRVPPWADFSAMERGQRLIASYGPWMGVSLFAGSLVGGAMFQKMAMVTAMTGMLSGRPGQRLTETTALVTRMALPGSVAPGGEAFEVLLRVRLLHAGLRQLLVGSGRFRHATEVPINQHDLAITLALFCYVNVRQLARLGVELEREQIESFHLLWRYAGHVLGIDAELLPASIEEQQAFYLSSCLHQVRPDKVPPETKALIDAVARQARPLPRGAARAFLERVTLELAGADYITGMGLAPRGGEPLARGFRSLGRAACQMQRHLPGAERLFYATFATLYRRAHARNERRTRYTYRVRTDERAAYRPDGERPGDGERPAYRPDAEGA